MHARSIPVAALHARVACLTLSLFAPAGAAANDTAAGGSGSDIVPLTTAEVRMVSEDILIRHVGGEGGDWDVQADYVFRNLTDAAITLQVGFPEYACEGGDPRKNPDIMCDLKPLHFKSMQTTVDGKPVVHRRGKLRKDHPWVPRMGQVWLYDARFEPGRDTHISHHYRVREGQVSDGTSLGQYVTRTGATWAGTIGHARFRIQLPARSRGAVVETKDSGLTLVSHLVEVDGATMGELLLEASDWEPATDLAFAFNVRPGVRIMDVDMYATEDAKMKLPPDEQCPNIAGVWSNGNRLVDRDSEAPAREPTDAEIELLLKEGLGNARLCRNYVFAYYGRRFDDDALNRYFYGEKGFVPGPWPYEAFEPNPSYSESWLTRGDRAALRLIDTLELKMKGGGASSSPNAEHAEGAAAPGTTGTSPSNTPSASAIPERGSAAQTPAATKTPTSPAQAGSGCGCRLAPARRPSAWLAAVLCVVVAARARRRAS